jgi:hypothetical protein
MANPLVVIDDLDIGGASGVKSINETRAARNWQAKAKIQIRNTSLFWLQIKRA